MKDLRIFWDRVLGEGSFGTVYYCKWYGTTAAAKVFQAKESKEIQNEIAIIKDLQNDNIIQFFGTVVHESGICLITSYALNGSLRAVLQRQTLLPEQKTGIIKGVINGMLFLKNKTIVHRDLKSPNVLLDKNYEPKICDFGLATLKLNSSSLREAPKKMGTLRWMAPELFSSTPEYSYASDMYALGLVIWEIFSGEIPYASYTEDRTIRKMIVDGKWQIMPSDITDHDRKMIESCWHYNPYQRISIEQLKHAYTDHFQSLVWPRDIAVGGSLLFATTVESDNLSELEDMLTGNTIANALQNIYSSSDSQYTLVVQEYFENSHGDPLDQYSITTLLDNHGEPFRKWIVDTAKKGYHASQTMLGYIYYLGYYSPEDYDKAFHWLEKAAQQGNAEAQYGLGTMYSGGHGVAHDEKTAAEWYNKAAESGHIYAAFKLGIMYENGSGVKEDKEKAVDLYKKAADQGYDEAEFALGYMYRHGHGIRQDYLEAVYWFNKAAKQGHTEAQHNLGYMYYAGRGVQKNEKRAIEWYTKAAEQGDHTSEYSLGFMYAEGHGVEKNYEKALAWYTKAAEHGNTGAQNNLGKIYHEGGGVERDVTKALEWYTKAAEKDDVVAMINLGHIYHEDSGVGRDDAKAAEWYRKAAEKGSHDGQYYLGYMYLKGYGVQRNHEEAIKLFKEAAEKGQVDAKNSLDTLLSNTHDGQNSETFVQYNIEDYEDHVITYRGDTTDKQYTKWFQRLLPRKKD